MSLQSDIEEINIEVNHGDVFLHRRSDPESHQSSLEMMKSLNSGESDCTRSNCSDHGDCSGKIINPTCSCDQGYEGPTCDTETDGEITVAGELPADVYEMLPKAFIEQTNETMRKLQSKPKPVKESVVGDRVTHASTTLEPTTTITSSTQETPTQEATTESTKQATKSTPSSTLETTTPSTAQEATMRTPAPSAWNDFKKILVPLGIGVIVAGLIELPVILWRSRFFSAPGAQDSGPTGLKEAVPAPLKEAARKGEEEETTRADEPPGSSLTVGLSLRSVWFLGVVFVLVCGIAFESCRRRGKRVPERAPEESAERKMRTASQGVVDASRAGRRVPNPMKYALRRSLVAAFFGLDEVEDNDRAPTT